MEKSFEDTFEVESDDEFSGEIKHLNTLMKS